MENIFLEKEEFERVFKYHLKIENYSTSIESLFSDRRLEKIDYKPHYQRNYVWDKHKASYFIESILLGTEIPPLIFYVKNNKSEVIDGRQRFETVNESADITSLCSNFVKKVQTIQQIQQTFAQLNYQH